MMNAGEVNIKEGIWMIRMEYFVLEEKMKGYECGWSKYSKHSERGAPLSPWHYRLYYCKWLVLAGVRTVYVQRQRPVGRNYGRDHAPNLDIAPGKSNVHENGA
jgi:hypothetical protein